MFIFCKTLTNSYLILALHLLFGLLVERHWILEYKYSFHNVNHLPAIWVIFVTLLCVKWGMLPYTIVFCYPLFPPGFPFAPPQGEQFPNQKLFHQKKENNKKANRLCMRFSSNPILVWAGTSTPYVKISATLLCCLLHFQRIS